MIYLFQTMSWTKLNWDLSWSEKISLSELLPKVNHSYPIELGKENKDYAKEGKVYFLWQPPHSELNGWYDKRPSEILKSYIATIILLRYSRLKQSKRLDATLLS